MTDRTTSTDRSAAFVQTMTERITTLTRTLAASVQAEPRSLQDLEEQIGRVFHDLGTALLTALVRLAAPLRPAADVDCSCGQLAHYQRLRPATVTTLLGRLTFTRALYHCAACGHGHAPLDAQLQVAAGGISAGLNEARALLGATQDSFAQASAVLERLCLVQVSEQCAGRHRRPRQRTRPPRRAGGCHRPADPHRPAPGQPRTAPLPEHGWRTGPHP